AIYQPLNTNKKGSDSVSDTKTVYQVDAEGYYEGPVTLDKTDKGAYGEWLIPARCTEAEPPAAKENYKIKWGGSAWSYEEIPAEPEPEAPTLDELKAQKLQAAGMAFAKRRDAVRWVQCASGRYGFDCASEDVTNFMAAYTPILIAGAGTTEYKVWTSETDKAVVNLTLADLNSVYSAVRAGQYEAYAWYETNKAAINAAKDSAELDTIDLEANN
ncbi:MAG: hypothetical protein PHQ45_02460, partial [Acidaminococcaceae bacterium]|nr:hypothetical protein [Acidaminococcaceae bacterium]